MPAFVQYPGFGTVPQAGRRPRGEYPFMGPRDLADYDEDAVAPDAPAFAPAAFAPPAAQTVVSGPVKDNYSPGSSEKINSGDRVFNPSGTPPRPPTLEPVPTGFDFYGLRRKRQQARNELAVEQYKLELAAYSAGKVKPDTSLSDQEMAMKDPKIFNPSTGQVDYGAYQGMRAAGALAGKHAPLPRAEKFGDTEEEYRLKSEIEANEAATVAGARERLASQFPGPFAPQQPPRPSPGGVFVGPDGSVFGTVFDPATGRYQTQPVDLPKGSTRPGTPERDDEKKSPPGRRREPTTEAEFRADFKKRTGRNATDREVGMWRAKRGRNQ